MSDALPTLGQRLKAERERRGMSTQKAADDLRLDAWVIEALEAGDYARIGPTVYAKGYLKKYASILGIPANEVIAGPEPAPAVPPAPMMRVTNAPAAPATASAGLLAAAVAFVAVACVAAILWWHPWRSSARGGPTAALAARDAGARGPAGTVAGGEGGTAGSAAAAASGAAGAAGAAGAMGAAAAQSTGAGAGENAGVAAGESEGPPVEGPAPGAAAVGEGEGADAPHAGRGALRTETRRAPLVTARSAERSPGASTATSTSAAAAALLASTVPPGAAAPEPAGAAEGVRGAGHARLRLSFSADSWVEVRDAAGRRVFAGQGRANSVQTVAGTAPLKVYLGYASGVQLEVNDRAVAIGRQFVRGDVARFEAGADGVLRRESGSAAPPTGAASPRGG